MRTTGITRARGGSRRSLAQSSVPLRCCAAVLRRCRLSRRARGPGRGAGGQRHRSQQRPGRRRLVGDDRGLGLHSRLDRQLWRRRRDRPQMLDSANTITATSPAGAGTVDVTRDERRRRLRRCCHADQFAYDPAPHGPWLGLDGNSDGSWTGSIGDFTFHNIVYDRGGGPGDRLAGGRAPGRRRRTDHRAERRSPSRWRPG